MLKLGLILFLVFSLHPTLEAAPIKEYILFKPGKGRIKSKIVLPFNKNAEFAQANYFELVDGNPIIKVWIEKELKEELEESSQSKTRTKESSN